MSNPADDLAARRALISSGIVGLTTAILTKFMDVKLDVSLPVSVATAITLDFLVNRHQNRVGIDVLETEAGKYLMSLSENETIFTTTYEDHLLFGVTSLMALNRTEFVMGAYQMLPEPYSKEELKSDFTELCKAVVAAPDNIDRLVDAAVSKIVQHEPRLITPDSAPLAVGRVAIFKGSNDQLLAMVFEGRTAAMVPCIRLFDETVADLSAALGSAPK